MKSFIGKRNEKLRIKFDQCRYKNTELLVEITILNKSQFEAEEKKKKEEIAQK